jgi:hypothetical protein
MARPERTQIVPSEDREAYNRWKARVLTWAAPVEPAGRTISDMPADYQDRFIQKRLVEKARRSAADHWSRSLVDPEDL